MSDTFDAPGSRNEAILQNMLGANNPLEPPRSRIEDLLQQLLEEGSGSGLPDVTSADNGKVLGVDNGEWVPIVNAIIINGAMTSQTGGTWTSEYTRQQIATAFAQGARIVFNVPGVASVNVGWIDKYQNMYALVYMTGMGVVLIQAGESGETRYFSFAPLS